jgi:hypothetical protein
MLPFRNKEPLLYESWLPFSQILHVFFVWWTRWRKRRTAGAKVTKTAGRVDRNHNSATAGRYNVNEEDTNTQSRQVDDA